MVKRCYQTFQSRTVVWAIQGLPLNIGQSGVLLTLITNVTVYDQIELIAITNRTDYDYFDTVLFYISLLHTWHIPCGFFYRRDLLYSIDSARYENCSRPWGSSHAPVSAIKDLDHAHGYSLYAPSIDDKGSRPRVRLFLVSGYLLYTPVRTHVKRFFTNYKIINRGQHIKLIDSSKRHTI